MRSVVITCEHGGNEIPAEFKNNFNNTTDLSTHLGYDIGALDLFHTLEDKYADFSASSTTSRLLVELNRSSHHPQLFSRFTKGLPLRTKKLILDEYYFPYRNSIQEEIHSLIQHGNQVIHISIHSFTPHLDGQKRNCDIGLLYDPKRSAEKAFCSRWKALLFQMRPNIKVRFNYPYKGTADGLTTVLRRVFAENYLGIELEVNQKHAVDNKFHTNIKNLLVLSLKEMLHSSI